MTSLLVYGIVAALTALSVLLLREHDEDREGSK
jgi:hypothetical protein